MNDDLKKAMEEEVRDAMRRSALVMREACVKFIRTFSNRVSTEDLVTMIEKIPLPGETSAAVVATVAEEAQ